MTQRLIPVYESGIRTSARIRQRNGDARTSKYFKRVKTESHEFSGCEDSTMKIKGEHTEVTEKIGSNKSIESNESIESIGSTEQNGLIGSTDQNGSIGSTDQNGSIEPTKLSNLTNSSESTPKSNPQNLPANIKLLHANKLIKTEPPCFPKLSENFTFPRKHPNVFDMVDIEDISPLQPKNWHLIYNKVVSMRALIFTPVDSMGCEKMADAINPGISHEEPRLFRFQILISLMLSAQTKDEVNYRAIIKLQNHLQEKGFDKLSMEGILSCSEADIDECIGQVGFHRRKAVYIKKASEMLRDNYGGDIPKTISEVTSLPGVGPKMGYLLLQIAWGINEGIGVDVHLHRLAVQWGWVAKSDKAEATRLELQNWLPRKYWADINPLLVGFGQSVCTPQAKNCDICTLSSGLCRGVDRRMLRKEMTPERREKLLKSRGDLRGLLE